MMKFVGILMTLLIAGCSGFTYGPEDSACEEHLKRWETQKSQEDLDTYRRLCV